MAEVLKPEPDQKGQPEEKPKKGCPMMKAVEPVFDTITQKPIGMRMVLHECAGEVCMFWRADCGMCGLLMVIGAVEAEGENPKQPEEN